ncbi:DUF2336 domain-containing protein [Oleomonas cavernae]|uniref:DUF2336 domain-containing protein n=1 Tax=Oleomonas cavernae TaxID=2320859 RepID=A0A418VTM4_9PROT|nr:DUF2336 domain-containing protein [Oleomonas cavernae]
MGHNAVLSLRRTAPALGAPESRFLLADSTVTRSDLEALLADPSPAHQARTAAKVAMAWRSGTLDGAARSAAEELFRAIAAKAVVAVRAALAEALKDEPSLPHEVALRLAHDVDAVALPMLEASVVLTDADLLDLVAEVTPAGISALAGRASVPAPLAEAIAGRGDEAAVARLVANPGRK